MKKMKTLKRMERKVWTKKGWLGICRAGASVTQGAAGSQCPMLLGCQTELRTAVPLSNTAGQ